jgi:hypothetical protein
MLSARASSTACAGRQVPPAKLPTYLIGRLAGSRASRFVVAMVGLAWALVWTRQRLLIVRRGYAAEAAEKFGATGATAHGDEFVLPVEPSDALGAHRGRRPEALLDLTTR